MINILMCYSNPTIVNMNWHYRKIVYKIIVNRGSYKITYFGTTSSSAVRMSSEPLVQKLPSTAFFWRENSFNAIKSYTNSFIVIQIYKFPSLPLIYNFCSLVCHCRYFLVDPSCTPLKLCNGAVDIFTRLRTEMLKAMFRVM